MQTVLYYADVSDFGKEGSGPDSIRFESLEETKAYKELYDRLPKYRRSKIDRLRYEKDKRLSLGAGALLIHALSEAGLPCDAEIVTAENGKPYLKDFPGVYFNLSHSGDKVICIISDHEVGCDVEKIRDRYDGVKNRFYMPGEREAIDACEDPEERRKLFFRYWTMKESYVKATGKALATEIENMDISDCPGYTFHEFDIFEGYCVSCCIKGECEIVLQKEGLTRLVFLPDNM